MYLYENLSGACKGGEAAGEARKAVETWTGVTVITSKNIAQLNQVMAGMIEGVVVDEQNKKNKQ